jgi:hypothetical protein
MPDLAIVTVMLDPTRGLLVVPATGDYDHIYRTATGVRWDREHRAFGAYEPKRWEAGELLTNIARAVAAEYGDGLHFTSKTSWQGVAANVQLELCQLLPFTVVP